MLREIVYYALTNKRRNESLRDQRFHIMCDINTIFIKEPSLLRYTLEHDNVFHIRNRESDLILFTYAWRY
jgi:hypothetical protein